MTFSLALTFGLAAAAHSVQVSVVILELPRYRSVLTRFPLPPQAASTNPADPDYERPVAGYVPVVSAALIFAVLFGLLTIGSWIRESSPLHRSILLVC